MNDVYKLMLNNEAFNNIIEKLINNDSVAIIKENDELSYLIKYFDEFVLNNFDNVRLQKLLDDIKQCDNYKKVDRKKLKVLKRKITNSSEEFIKIFSAFIDNKFKEYSLNDLYSITKKSIEFKDDEFEYYSLLSKSPFILENDSSIIIVKVEELIRNKYVDSFIKYKKFNNNKRFSIIKENISIKEIDCVINKLSGVLNNSFAFIPPIYINEYTSDFEREQIYYKNYSCDEIRDIVKNINYKHNKEKIDSIESIKWYNWFNLKRYKEISNKKKKFYSKYKDNEDTIYNQYIENIENLQMFATSFSFVNKVFKDSVLDEINNRITNEEELYNYISYIKETLDVYKEYLKVKKIIDILDKTSMELLDYIYEKIDEKVKLNNILEFVPKYYLYKEIESIEEIKRDVINKYDRLYEKVDKLYQALNMYDSMLLQSIREECNKEIKNAIVEMGLKYDEIDFTKLSNERYKEENIKFLLRLFPIVILNNEQYTEYKEKIDGNFSLVVNQDELASVILNNDKKDKAVCGERLDKDIIKMLNTVGYDILIKENYDSIIYVNYSDEKNREKVIYINNKEEFGYNDINKILELRDNYKKIVFVWYRNWWLNKNDEVSRIQKLLND